MKLKIFFGIIVLYILFINICYAGDFIYLQDGIYYKKGSLKYENGYASAEFKVINNEDLTYNINKYRAYCNSSNGLKIITAKKYGSSGVLLENYISKESYAYSDYKGLVNGHIYYDFICKKPIAVG